MEAHDITSDRIDLLPLTAGNTEHLATYAHMDISLDPWPYAGTTTTCESLYMGVPVISLAGKIATAKSPTCQISISLFLKDMTEHLNKRSCYTITF